MRRAEPVVPRDLGAGQRMPPPSSSSALSARRLYIDDCATSSKVASLSSVSPTSSTRELTMRSLSCDEDEESHAVRTEDNNKDYYHTQHTKTIVHRRETHRGTSARSTKASAGLADIRLETDPAGDELQHVKDSVQRLRAQRTRVEQLRHRNERLERLLADGAAEAERLRLQVASLRGVEQENVGLLRSFQMLEERIRALETTCGERREDARVALERLAAAEKARDTLQLRVDELAGERELCRQQLTSAQVAHDKRLEELTTAHERALERARHAQSEWQAKLQDAQLTQGHVERRFQDELGELKRENQQLVRENRAMEQHVQQLLATTVRQTTMIEDCDRLLHESKSRHAAAKASYREQVQLVAGLREKVQQLESQLSVSEVGGATDKRALEVKLQELETKARKLKDKNEIYVVALREKENHCEKLQNELLVRDRARLHAEDVVKELRQHDKTLRSEISTLQVKLADLTDEKSILLDQLRSLQEQLEKERRDRSRWATARLKLLAEFCDEENKLSSALHQYSALDMFVDEGSEAGQEDDLVDPGDGEDEDAVGDVAAAVMAAGLKMDALDRKFHGRQGIQEAVKHQRPPGKSIVFG